MFELGLNCKQNVILQVTKQKAKSDENVLCTKVLLLIVSHQKLSLKSVIVKSIELVTIS